MKAYLSAAAFALALQLAAAPAGFAQAPPPAVEAGLSLRALANLPASGKLTVTSPAFKNGGDIPFENTQYRGNVFPGLMWTKGPAGTKSYAVIMQDTDGVRNGQPIFHWSLYNIPATVTKLDAGMTEPPAGSVYGPNIRGKAQPYMGPRTPAGPKHRYHLQVFALDTTLGEDAGNDYDSLVGAMKAHVLAEGEVVGLGQVDPTAPPPAPRPAR
jgi:para-nitrobenzyl esterase